MKPRTRCGYSNVKLTKKFDNQVLTTKQWLRRNFKNKSQSIFTLDHNLLLTSYNSFCTDAKEIPLNNSQFLEVLRNHAECYSDDDNDSNFSDDLFVESSNEDINEEPVNSKEVSFVQSSSNEEYDKPVNDITMQNTSGNDSFSKNDDEDEENDSGFESQETANEDNPNGNENNLLDIEDSEDIELSEELSNFIMSNSCDEKKSSKFSLKKSNGYPMKFKPEDISTVSSNSDSNSQNVEENCSSNTSNNCKDLDQTHKISSKTFEEQVDAAFWRSSFNPFLSKCKFSPDHNHEFKIKPEAMEVFFLRVSKLLSLQNYENSSCISSAKKFSYLLQCFIKAGKLGNFVHIFGHSFSCKEKHGSLCFMFKRITHHLATKADHLCAVKEVYGHVFRLHLDSCFFENCGIPDCKNLQKIRLEKCVNMIK